MTPTPTMPADFDPDALVRDAEALDALAGALSGRTGAPFDALRALIEPVRTIPEPLPLAIEWDGGEGSPSDRWAVLVCPYCGCRESDLRNPAYVEDSRPFHDFDRDAETVIFDGSANYDDTPGGWIECVSCGSVVDLPEGWTSDYR